MRRPQASAQPHRPTEPWLSSHPASNKQGNGYAPHPRENAPARRIGSTARDALSSSAWPRGPTPWLVLCPAGIRKEQVVAPCARPRSSRMEFPWDCAFSEIVQDAGPENLLGTCRPQLALGTPTAPVRSAARPGRRAATMGRKANGRKIHGETQGNASALSADHGRRVDVCRRAVRARRACRRQAVDRLLGPLGARRQQGDGRRSSEEWAEKEKVEVQIDFITSQGNKILLTDRRRGAGEGRATTSSPSRPGGRSATPTSSSRSTTSWRS